jgi:hypothetical protein
LTFDGATVQLAAVQLLNRLLSLLLQNSPLTIMRPQNPDASSKLDQLKRQRGA